MRLPISIPAWLTCGLLYGLSWPILPPVNLSFLAWVAFVPLFIYWEEQQNSLWKTMLASSAAMLVFALISAGWLFNFPQSKWLIAVVILSEAFLFFFPFLPFYFIQRRVGFEKAIWLFPLLWTAWEWLYLGFEFSTGTHLAAYSQSSNLWLIQFIDLSGMWGISCWLLYFNVFVYKAFKAAESQWKSITFIHKLSLPLALMLGLPLAYGLYTHSQFSSSAGQSLKVSLLPTQYTAAYLNDPSKHQEALETSLHRTDSLAADQIISGIPADIYVWPETTANYQLDQANLGQLLQEAVTDWDGALLTGCKSSSENNDTSDQRSFVSAALLSAQAEQPSYHHKTVLTPGQEMIPYHSFLADIPGFPIPEKDPRFRRKGGQSTPLELLTRDERLFKLGISLCFEQWYPSHWTRLAQNGAELYFHIAGEGWYGNFGFQQFMANVTRLRSIENRRAVARCSNVGLSGFFDAFGRFRQPKSKTALSTMTDQISASHQLSFYSRWPNWFPISCLLILSGSLLKFYTKSILMKNQIIQLATLSSCLLLLLLPTTNLKAGLAYGTFYRPSQDGKLEFRRTYLSKQLNCNEDCREWGADRQFSTTGGRKSGLDLIIDFADFTAHLAAGRDRIVQTVSDDVNFIPWNVGLEDVTDGVWDMPDLSLYGPIDQITSMSVAIENTPFSTDYPSATHAYTIGSGLFSYYELEEDDGSGNGNLFYHGDADADFIYIGDFIQSPVPLQLNLGEFGGELPFIFCDDLDDGCIGYPTAYYFVTTQYYEEVATGMLNTYDDGMVEAFKVRHREEIAIYDADDVELDVIFIDDIVWYSKEGHYIIATLADGAPWAGATEFVNIEYHRLEPIALPVQWYEVAATPTTRGEVIVNWSTEAEQDNARFIIEQSLDGQSFTAIGESAARGNSEGITHYDFTDVAPQEGLNYYRIQQQDFDGANSYSTIVSALVNKTEQEEELLLVYPNPGFDQVYFSQAVNYELYNQQGQLLSQGRTEGILNVVNLPKGSYQIRIEDGEVFQWVKN